MSIADKIARAKEDYNDVYDHGWSKGNMAGISEGFENGRNLGHQEGYDEGYAAGIATGGGGGGGGGMDAFFEKMDSLNYLFVSNYNADLKDYVLSRDLTGKKCQYVFLDNTTTTDASIIGKPSLIHGLFQRCTSLVNAEVNTEGVVVITDVFNGCTSLKNAGTIDFSSVTYASRTFQNCSALEEIRITGEIKIDVDMRWSTKLSKESILSIMWALSETSTGKTITLSKTAVDVAFAYDGFVGSDTLEWGQRVIDRPNWTVNLV